MQPKNIRSGLVTLLLCLGCTPSETVTTGDSSGTDDHGTDDDGTGDDGTSYETSSTGGHSVTTESPQTETQTTDGPTGTGPPGICGDAVLDANEACDDGNTDDDDGCSSNCLEANCLVTVTHPTVQAAIDDETCSAVYVPEGTYFENLVILRGVAIFGVGTSRPIIDGGGLGTTITIDSAGLVDLEHLVVTGGNGDNGGGIFVSGEGYEDVFLGVELLIEGNRAQYGGGIYGSMVLHFCVVRDNQALRNGAGIRAGYLELYDSEVASNHLVGDQLSLAAGAGIGAQESLVIRRSVVRNNAVLSDTEDVAAAGIGFFTASGGIAGITDSTIRDNTGGSGVYVFTENEGGSLGVGASTISGNGGCRGSAILFDAHPHNFETDILSIKNSTISGNGDENTADCSAIATIGTFNSAVEVKLSNTTVTQNAGTGLFLDDTPAQLHNTILYGHPDGDCEAVNGGTLTSVHYSVLGEMNCGMPNLETALMVDPELLPLADNGGPTKTHHLVNTSPAIDTGNPDDCTGTLDQRGLPRTANGRCDIGAIEVQ